MGRRSQNAHKLVSAKSSSSAASSNTYFDTTKVFEPNVKYGSHTDSRDGRVSRTVIITLKYEHNGRNNITVFTENLNYGKMRLHL